MNVIDFDALDLPAPSYVYDFPHGAGRYVQGASGYDYTIVNGEVFMDHGEHTGRARRHDAEERAAPGDLTPTRSSVLDAARRRRNGSTARAGRAATELRAKYLGEGRVVEVAEYEPKMNVTPNAVALKDD